MSTFNFYTAIHDQIQTSYISYNYKGIATENRANSS
jgi:hypothetical protein